MLRLTRRELETGLRWNSEPTAQIDRVRLETLHLAADWNRPEEGAAWSHLQQARSS
jgi:hypothetical protein